MDTSGRAPRQIVLQTGDPDEFTERVQPVAPRGVRMRPTGRGAYRSRLRAFGTGRCSLLSLRVEGGRVEFPGDRGSAGITLPFFGGFQVATGRHMTQFAVGLAYADLPLGEEHGIEPLAGSHLLGANVDGSLFEAHARALDGHWEARPPPPNPMVRMATPPGRRLALFLDGLWRELAAPDSRVHTPLVAREIEDRLAGLLADACHRPHAAAPSTADAIAARAEELLAAHLDRPLSLADVARATETSTRSLSRAFQMRHGVGPIAFLRRRRLEAARRDLIDAEHGETSVTDVALRYGFAHLGRFSVDYGRTFGESPSVTLRS